MSGDWHQNMGAWGKICKLSGNLDYPEKALIKQTTPFFTLRVKMR